MIIVVLLLNSFASKQQDLLWDKAYAQYNNENAIGNKTLLYIKSIYN